MTTKQVSAKRHRQTKQKIMAALSVLFFFGTTGSGIVNFVKQTRSEPAPVENQPAVDPLQQQEQGYEMVLQREPENQTALEGLVNTRLQMNDKEGAIEPLEKLVKLYPSRVDYVTALNGIKQK